MKIKEVSVDEVVMAVQARSPVELMAALDKLKTLKFSDSMAIIMAKSILNNPELIMYGETIVTLVQTVTAFAFECGREYERQLQEQSPSVEMLN